MDQALTRTRRNMIGVGVVLAAIYAFGWRFPSEIRFFGNLIQANAAAVKLIIWVALGYFTWEYLLHVKDKRTLLQKEWRDRFVDAHQSKLEKQIEEKFDRKKLDSILAEHRHRGFDSVEGVSKVKLTAAAHHLFRQDISITTLVGLHGHNGHTNAEIPEPEPYKAYYLWSVPKVLRAWIGCLFTSSQYFEYFLPLIFPIGAVLSAAFGPFSVLGGETAPTPHSYPL